MNTTPTVSSQGPSWLAEFLMHPPLWFKAVLVLTAGYCLTLAARNVLQRDLYISREEQWSIALILGTVEAVVLGVVASMTLLPLGFVGDTAVGAVAGFAVTEVIRKAAPPIADRVADEQYQLLGVWLLLMNIGLVIPWLAGPAQTPIPGGFDIGIGTVAFCMFVWTAGQEFGDGETLGDAIRAE